VVHNTHGKCVKSPPEGHKKFNAGKRGEREGRERESKRGGKKGSQRQGAARDRTETNSQTNGIEPDGGSTRAKVCFSCSNYKGKYTIRVFQGRRKAWEWRT